MTSQSTAAAKALLVYYDRALAKRLAKFVMDRASDQFRNDVYDAIAKLIPSFISSHMSYIVASIQKTVDALLASETYKEKIKKYCDDNLDDLLYEQVDDVARERVNRAFQTAAGTKDILSKIPERLSVLVDEEMKRIAKNAVEKHKKLADGLVKASE